MRPLTEVLTTVVLDRGGAPLHFVLAHAVLAANASSSALRWLSVLFALASVPLCFDLGQRLGGMGAGVIAAVVAASSTALAVYGSFGRMYALLVFAAALFGDLFVRALQLRPPAGAGGVWGGGACCRSGARGGGRRGGPATDLRRPTPGQPSVRGCERRALTRLPRRGLGSAGRARLRLCRRRR